MKKMAVVIIVVVDPIHIRYFLCTRKCYELLAGADWSHLLLISLIKANEDHLNIFLLRLCEITSLIVITGGAKK
jgi:hypothetical protein